MTMKDKKDQKTHTATKTAVDNKRRKAMGKIVATSGIAVTMSGNWKKPLLSSVVIPAHALTTCDDDGGSSEDSASCDSS